MFFKVIACEIAFREMCMAAARSPNLVDFDFLSQGYHDNPEIGLAKIQERIDAIDREKVDAILLGYGLCNNLVVGLQSRDVQIVIPRAHDCITFFLGSQKNYKDYFFSHPGTYYYTSGWLEYRGRGGERVERKQGAGWGEMQSAARGDAQSYADMVAKYGEDNAQYLMSFMNQWIQHYTHGAYIRFDFCDHLGYRERVEQICRDHGWEYTELEGDLSLIQRWIDGDWAGEDFLVVPPDHRVMANYEESVLSCQPVSGAS